MRFDATLMDVLTLRQKERPAQAKKATQRMGGYGDSNTPTSSRGRNRLSRILQAATELFLKNGFRETAIDDVLSASGGSKATLYSYFSTKDELFRAVVDDILSAEPRPSIRAGNDHREALNEFALETYRFLSSFRHRSLLRLIISERERFPDLAERYWESVPMNLRSELVQCFKELERRSVLEQGKAEEAADMLFSAITHRWLIESLLLGTNTAPDADAIRGRVARALERYLKQ